ncbi:MAG TPA: FAD-dependent oxidoreductase [Thermomicrobiales bacterium]|nr:FAD-dependent oxidoreductase [Thermomicrobiales bacterium]
MAGHGTEVAVVGGGIMGSSLAWHLARRGVRVTLLERATVASGGSGRTGALLRRHYTNVPEATLAQKGWETYANWPEVVGGEPVHSATGLIVTVDAAPGREGNVEKLRANVALQNRLGIPARAVGPDDLRELQPFATWDDVRLAAYEPDSGYVDAVAATRGMVLAAADAGAEMREACPVLGVATDGARVMGVRTADGFLPAGIVVVAAGPWTNRLLAGIGVELPIEALRVQVAILHRPLELERPHVVYLDTAAGIFCRPWGPGRTLVGVGGGDQHDPVDPDAYREQNDRGYPALAIAAIARRIPAMARASYLGGHAGLYDMSPDTHPLIGPVGPDGLYVMAGFSGAGFKKGPAVGQAMAELILDGKASFVDLHPFRPGRFAEPDFDPAHPWSETEYAFGRDFGHRL